ncbi:hypothetical protein [Pantoea piersonii]|uniref:hypothetical protein n=1 Tax=Pantoea piersonii TaxID=2364647 RepID=UPI0022F14BE8|nr:hypothetical protein [Pantoea piersonii]WBV20662.1 hypothetical protein PG877_13750 [Pantoea piersonii]
MELQQIALIHSFYSHFLLEIYAVSSREYLCDESEMKREIKKWLHLHKKRKTFGELCRNEILFIEKEVDNYGFKELRIKIHNLEKNCRIMKVNAEANLMATV